MSNFNNNNIVTTSEMKLEWLYLASPYFDKGSNGRPDKYEYRATIKINYEKADKAEKGLFLGLLNSILEFDKNYKRSTAQHVLDSAKQYGIIFERSNFPGFYFMCPTQRTKFTSKNGELCNFPVPVYHGGVKLMQDDIPDIDNSKPCDGIVTMNCRPVNGKIYLDLKTVKLVNFELYVREATETETDFVDTAASFDMDDDTPEEPVKKTIKPEDTFQDFDDEIPF